MENPIVQITEGQLRGSVGTNIDNEKFYSFLGIPYGKPPTGNLRFKAPLPAEPWEDIKDATKEGNQCIQKGMDLQTFKFSEYVGSEDCLILNVFTKTLPSKENKLKPVMVFIHGGAFMMGSSNSDMFGPGILMTEDIVLVTINYRVGVLGFLSLNDTSLEVPGNAGLKDQRLALKWVQKNIKFFNGDPDNVTIFGESAGAASVHYLTLSHSTEGLFHKAIAQSGTALSPWAYSDENAIDFCKYLGISTTNEKDLLEKLIELPIEEILKAQDFFSDEKKTILKIFGPVIESPNESEFISKDPIDIIKSGEYIKVPVIFGYTSNEGLLDEFMKGLYTLQGKSYNEPTIDNQLPWQLELEKDSDARKAVVEKLRNFYENENNKDNPYLMSSDALFVASIVAAVHNQVKIQKEPIYLYRMSILTGRNYLRSRMTADPKLGVCHGDDLGYLFTNSTTTDKIIEGSPEDIGVRRFVKLWTNFAKYGNPTPNEEELGVIWKAVEKNSRYFLDIGQELVLDKDPEQERMQIWKEIFQINPRTAPYLE